MRLLITSFVALASAAAGAVIPEVRAAIAQNDFSLGESQIKQYKSQNGVTPEMLEALSWLGRGSLAAKQLDKAEAYAVETRQLALEQLKKRALDAEPHLPIALGASIEVQAHVKAARGERSEAVAFLQKELAAWKDTSIRTRIQKNLHLLSLEGQIPPPLEIKEWLGPQPQPLSALKGKPVVLFFWAHWCGDCKQEGPILARLKTEYAAKGLTIVAPTQRYGYMARGQDASPQQEVKYIEQVRNQYYADLLDVPAPVSEENFKVYGASTTPTLVLLDRKGAVRMYHPGRMSHDELAAQIEAILR